MPLIDPDGPTPVDRRSVIPRVPRVRRGGRGGDRGRGRGGMEAWGEMEVETKVGTKAGI